MTRKRTSRPTILALTLDRTRFDKPRCRCGANQAYGGGRPEPGIGDDGCRRPERKSGVGHAPGDRGQRSKSRFRRGLDFTWAPAYSQKGFAIESPGQRRPPRKSTISNLRRWGACRYRSSERAAVHLLAGPAAGIQGVLYCVSTSFMGEETSEDCGDDGPKAMDLGLMGGARLEFGVSEKTGPLRRCALQPRAHEHGRQR